jgi:hypothetical protein
LPGTGVHPATPQPLKSVAGSKFWLPRKSMNQIPPSKAPILSRPSPFQSPTTGVAPGEPQPTISVFGSNEKSPLMSRNHANVDGSMAPMLVTPLPFQSHQRVLLWG